MRWEGFKYKLVYSIYNVNCTLEFSHSGNTLDSSTNRIPEQLVTVLDDLKINFRQNTQNSILKIYYLISRTNSPTKLEFNLLFNLLFALLPFVLLLVLAGKAWVSTNTTGLFTCATIHSPSLCHNGECHNVD